MYTVIAPVSGTFVTQVLSAGTMHALGHQEPCRTPKL